MSAISYHGGGSPHRHKIVGKVRRSCCGAFFDENVLGVGLIGHAPHKFAAPFLGELQVVGAVLACAGTSSIARRSSHKQGDASGTARQNKGMVRPGCCWDRCRSALQPAAAFGRFTRRADCRAS